MPLLSDTHVTKLLLDHSQFNESVFMKISISLGWNQVDTFKAGIGSTSEDQDAKKRIVFPAATICIIGRWLGEKIEYMDRKDAQHRSDGCRL